MGVPICPETYSTVFVVLLLVNIETDYSKDQHAILCGYSLLLSYIHLGKRALFD